MDIKELFRCPVCRNIPEHNRETFINGLKFKTKRFKKGDFIATQGDVVDALYILIKGKVKAEMISESGTVLNIETIEAPYPLASAFLFAENNRFPVDVIALEDCEVIIINKESIMKQLACDEKFLQGYMAFNSNRAQFLSERIRLLSIKTIKGKLAYYILERTKNGIFTMDMNQKELAEYFGVTRPSLARSLSEMVDEGVVELERKEGKVLNVNALKELIIM